MIEGEIGKDIKILKCFCFLYNFKIIIVFDVLKNVNLFRFLYVFILVYMIMFLNCFFRIRGNKFIWVV